MTRLLRPVPAIALISGNTKQKLEIIKNKRIVLFDDYQPCPHCHTLLSENKIDSKEQSYILKTCILPYGLFVWTGDHLRGESWFIDMIICLDCIGQPNEE